jgi:hypothetical protein
MRETFSMPGGLLLVGGEVGERRVQPACVVPALYPADDLPPGVGAGGESAAVHQLALEGGEERLGGAVVEADSGGAHRLGHPEPFAQLAVVARGVLAAPVGVEHDAVDVPAAGGDGHLERRGHQRGAQVVGDTPADDAA